MMRVWSSSVSTVISFVFSIGKKPMMENILYRRRTNDTNIHLDIIYMEKDNLLLLDVDVLLISG